MTKFSPFVENRDSIIVAASEIYRAERIGVEADPDRSRVMLVPQELLEAPDWKTAKVIEAKINIAARVVARLALLQDTVDRGGISGVVARGEIALTRLIERPYVEGAMSPGGIVEVIRTDYTDPNAT